jgi:hypothetical protein
MKFRSVLFVAVIALTTSMLISCGGGDAMGVLSSVPKGKYYQLEGTNPAAKYNSEIFAKIADELDKFEDEKDDWEDKLDEMGIDNPQMNNLKLSVTSEDSEENLKYLAGGFKVDDLEDYFTDKDFGGWDDWDEDDRDNVTYYTGKKFNVDQAVFIHGPGFFQGQESVIEDIIDVVKKGDRQMVATEEFRENRDLVDFNATNFMLHFDNADDLARNFTSMVKMVDDDEDIIEPLEDLSAAGVSVYWTNELRLLIKLRFDKEKDLDPFVEFLREDMDKILEEIGPQMARSFFGPDVKTDDMDELADDARVDRSGPNVMIEIRLTWKVIEEMIG